MANIFEQGPSSGSEDQVRVQKFRDKIEKLKERDEDEARRLNEQYDVLLKKRGEAFTALDQYEHAHPEMSQQDLERDPEFAALGKTFDEAHDEVEDFEAKLNEQSPDYL